MLDAREHTQQAGRVKFSKLILYLFVVGVGLFLVVEVLVRLLFPQPLDPGRTFVVENEIPGLKPKVRYKIDVNQIRGFESTKAKPDGALRILCVGGDSTSTMLQAVEDTWWGQLGAKLEASLGKEVQIGCITALRSAEIIGGAQWIDHMLGEVDGVDLVIAMYGHRAVLAPGVNFRFDPQSIEPIIFESKQGLMFNLASASHVVRLARNAHIKSKRDAQQRQLGKPNHLRDRFTAAGQAFRSITKTTSAPPRATDPRSKYLHGIGVFTEIAKRHGVKLLILGEPTVFSERPSPDAAETLYTPVQIGPESSDFARPASSWVDSELGRYYAAASKLCEAAAVPFVNLHGAIEPSRDKFYTEATLTDAGALKLAEELLPSVEKLLK